MGGWEFLGSGINLVYDCYPAIGGLGQWGVRGSSIADPRPSQWISIRTMPRDAGPLSGAEPVGS